ncbi:MAG: LapA family protein, partial [Actinomycetota bacterium]|nr:LapA family protein [Actinomycetota bacterium]
KASGPRSADLVRHLPAAILVIVLVAFAVDNRRKVTVGFLVTDKRVPLVFVLVATAVIGALVGALLRHRRR